MKITDYKTAVGQDIPELDQDVQKLIKAGFEPFGNPYFAHWGQVIGKGDTSRVQLSCQRRLA